MSKAAYLIGMSRILLQILDGEASQTRTPNLDRLNTKGGNLPEEAATSKVLKIHLPTYMIFSAVD